MLNSIAQKNIIGEYSLEGVMEIASGFELKADSSFEFFFSYGALDRYGSGRWSIKNDSIILNSKPYPGKDFKLVNSVASSHKFSTIKIENSNTYLYRLVYCRVKSAEQDSIFSFDEDGTLALPYAVDSIQFLSELCPERASEFVIDKSSTIYTFNFQPWILEVFFNEAAFHFSNDLLEGRHPLLDDKIYRFKKENTPSSEGNN